MPRLIAAAGALVGLERCRRFLAARNQAAPAQAAAVIRDAFHRLFEHPEIGRPVDGAGDLRELIVPFGASGYVVLYTFDREAAGLLILAFRHQKEAGC